MDVHNGAVVYSQAQHYANQSKLTVILKGGGIKPELPSVFIVCKHAYWGKIEIPVHVLTSSIKKSHVFGFQHSDVPVCVCILYL